MKFQATYAFNVRRFIRCDIDADTPEDATAIARNQAKEKIDHEILNIQNSDGYGDVAILDAYLMLDALDNEKLDVIVEEPLPDLDEQ